MITWLEKPTTVCAWCGATEVEGDWIRPLGRPPMDAFLSHGICPDCASAYTNRDPKGTSTSGLRV